MKKNKQQLTKKEASVINMIFADFIEKETIKAIVQLKKEQRKQTTLYIILDKLEQDTKNM